MVAEVREIFDSSALHQWKDNLGNKYFLHCLLSRSRKYSLVLGKCEINGNLII